MRIAIGILIGILIALVAGTAGNHQYQIAVSGNDVFILDTRTGAVDAYRPVMAFTNGRGPIQVIQPR